MAINGSINHEDASRIPVAYLVRGYENNRKTIIDFYRNAVNRVNWVIDAIQPPVTSKMEWLIEEIYAARRRGVMCRTIADITKDNLLHCKEMMARTDELRHLGGIGVVFGVTDFESVTMVPSLESREEIEKIQLIHSNSENVVDYKKLIFDALWTRATPAESRINELGGDLDRATTAEPTKAIIDRIYMCRYCRQTFIYPDEVEEHRKVTGHQDFREFPIV